MNAKPVAGVLKETISNPPRLPDLGQGSRFVSLLAPSTPAASATTATQSSQSATHANAAPKIGSGSGSSSKEQSAHTEPHRKSHGGPSAVVIPLPVPTLLSFQQPEPATGDAAAAAPAAGAGTLSLQGLLQQAVPAEPAGAAPAPPLPVIPAANAAAAGQAETPAAQGLSSIAAALNARIATGAATLVSQPRVALANRTPETTQPANAKAPAVDGDATAAPKAPDAPELLHVAPKQVAPALPQDANGLIAGAAKSAASMQLAEHAAAGAPPQNASTNDDADADAGTNAPTLSTMAPPPANAAPTAAPAALVVPHGVAEQVAVNLRQAVKAGADHIEIQLHPADLGAISVKLNVNHDGRVTMVVSADHSDTLNLLKQDAGSLAQALRDAGLQADNSSLSFNLRGGYQFNQQAGANGGSRYADAASPDAIDDAVGIAAATTLRLHSGSLDIQV